MRRWSELLDVAEVIMATLVIPKSFVGAADVLNIFIRAIGYFAMLAAPYWQMQVDCKTLNTYTDAHRCV